MAPIELTTQSLVKVEWDSSRTLSLVAQNAPVEAVIKQILAKTGWKPKLPTVIRGRTTYSSKGSRARDLLSYLANRNELEVRFAPDGTPAEIYPTPAAHDVYSLTDEQRLAASKTTIAPTVPTTGITTGYVIYSGHYIPPPYQVSKDRVRLFDWEVRINGLTVRTVIGAPPKDWQPGLPAGGQLAGSNLIRRYCARLWREAEAAGRNYEQIRKDIEKFLGTQKVLKSFEWVGKYTVRIVEMDGTWTPLVVRDPPYPTGDQLQHELEILSSMWVLMDRLRSEGKAKSYSDVEPAIIEALLEQEGVAGPKDLPPEERRLRAQRYCNTPEVAMSLRMHWSRAPGPDRTYADFERTAEQTRLKIEQSLTSAGLVIALEVPGDTVWTPPAPIALLQDYGKLEALTTVTNSAAPIDVKVCVLRDMGVAHGPVPAWLFLANFHPTPELKERLSRDKNRVLQEWEAARKRLIPPGLVPWRARPLAK